MGIGLIFALFSSVPENYASDAAPFTTAKSSASNQMVSYTVTGPKQESTRAAAFAFLGVPWLIIGLISPFVQIAPPSNNSTSSANTIGLTIFFIVLGGLMCRQAFKRQRAASRKCQVEINTRSHGAIFFSTKSDEIIECNTPIIMICKTPDEKYYTIAIVRDGCSILLGMLRSRESAVLYAELLAEENNLPIGDSTGIKRTPYVYHPKLVQSDSKALEKPIVTKPLPNHFQ